MHANSRHERRGGETIEASFDKITGEVAGEQKGGLGGQQGVGKVVHRIRLCVSARRRV
jgi:hypothetical protein